MLQCPVNTAMPELCFDENRTIYEGQEFTLKQYGGDQFATFMAAFFDNYAKLHKPLGTLTRELKFEDEQEENYLLQPTSVCLAVERNGQIAFTLMATRRDSRPIHQDGIFGLDYRRFYEKKTLGGNTLYYFGKASVNLGLFSAGERKAHVGDLQLMLYQLVFSIARKDNCNYIYSYINRFIARSMQKQGIAYSKITPYSTFRGIGYAGVGFSASELDAMTNNYDFDAIVERYFG